MPYFILQLISLFSFWLLLSGFWDNMLLLGFGVASALFAAYIGMKIKQHDEFKLDLQFFLRFPKYIVWLIGQIWTSNVDTAKRIWLPQKFPISPTLSKLKTTQATSFGQSIYANSITITPGTVSVDIDGDELTVHALSHHSIDELERGEMDARVTKLETKQ